MANECTRCGLPRFYGPTGVAAPQCMCAAGYGRAAPPAKAQQVDAWRNRWPSTAAVHPSALAQAQKAETVPEGYKLVLVPDEVAADEPDWAAVQRQAEEAYGVKVGDVTMPILIREVRRWIAQKYAAPAPEATPAQAQQAAPEGWETANAVGDLMLRLDQWKATNPRTAPPAWAALIEACRAMVAAADAKKSLQAQEQKAAVDRSMCPHQHSVDDWRLHRSGGAS